MGCCGQPYDETTTNSQKQLVANNSYPTNQQPSPHPGTQYQEKQFLPPTIPSPAPTQQFGSQNGAGANGFPQQPWQQQMLAGSPPPPSTSPPPFNPYQLSGSPSPPIAATQFSGSNLHGMANMAAVQRPMPYYPGASAAQSSIMMTTSKLSGMKTPETVPAADEGKMSISIDFGASPTCKPEAE